MHSILRIQLVILDVSFLTVTESNNYVFIHLGDKMLTIEPDDTAYNAIELMAEK